MFVSLINKKLAGNAQEELTVQNTLLTIVVGCFNPTHFLGGATQVTA